MISSSLTYASIKEFTKHFIEHIKLNSQVSIVVGNMKKIKEYLLNLAFISPEYKEEIDEISKRLVDIRAVFVDHWYYDPKFKGSYYFKHIVPIMCPEISYSNLLIKSGVQAQYEFRRLGNDELAVRTYINGELKKYGLMDVVSLFAVFKFLKKESSA